MVNSVQKKISSASIMILVSNVIAGLAFIVAGIIINETILMVGGIFVICAGIAFKFIMQRMLKKIEKNSEQ
ncbi:MAG: hypothetical protein WHV28_08210 [Bacteroidota bacterium]